MSDDNRDLRVQEAKRWWDLVLRVREYSKEYGIAAIRSLIVINGGAVVATLAAISTIFSKDDTLALKIAASLNYSFAAFLAALVLAIVAACMGYFNFYFAGANMPGPHELHQYIQNGNIAGWKQSRLVTWTMWVAVGCVILSLLLFCVGAFLGVRSFTGLSVSN